MVYLSAGAGAPEEGEGDEIAAGCFLGAVTRIAEGWRELAVGVRGVCSYVQSSDVEGLLGAAWGPRGEGIARGLFFCHRLSLRCILPEPEPENPGSQDPGKSSIHPATREAAQEVPLLQHLQRLLRQRARE